ncbi:MAG: nuclear transport factor 2 family protein [Rubricoccaceae bacterium]
MRTTTLRMPPVLAVVLAGALSAAGCTAAGGVQARPTSTASETPAITPEEALARPLAYPVQSVRATVAELFDALRARDTTALRALFHPAMRLHTVVRTGQEPPDTHRLTETSLEAFLASVGSAAEVLDERVGLVEVRADDGLATAWMPYRFYVGDRFAHCGVNAMQLVLSEGRWRILNITDTRRRGCE